MTCSPALRCLLAAFAALLFLVADGPGEPPPVHAAVGDIFEFPIPTANSQPYSIVRAWDGNVWFNGSHNKLGRLGPTGITEFPIATPGGVNNLALAVDGTVWFTRANSVAKVSPDGVVTEYPVPVFGNGPGAITAGPDDAMWFTYGNAPKIGRITGGGVVTIQDITTTDASSFVPIASGPDGNLWLAYYASNKIVRLTPGLVATEFPVPTPGGAPVSITSGPDGNLWFTEYTSNKIGRITPAGIITEWALSAGALKPFVITTGTDGALWFTEEGSNMIGRITPSGDITRYPIPTANSQPVGIASCGVLICFTEFAGNRIGVLHNGSSTVVNTLADASPPVTDGLCSLREAITNANNNAATFPDCPGGTGNDTITFSVSGTVVLAAALPDITDAAGLTVDGSLQSVTLNGNDAVRHFRIMPAATMELSHLTLTKGYPVPGLDGGSLLNEGTLTVRQSTIHSNAAGTGGGIHNGASGSALIFDTTIRDNVASEGGGIQNRGVLTVSRSTLSGNVATDSVGGGITSIGDLTLTNSTVSTNTTVNDGGGGIFLGYFASTNIVRITNSTIVDNFAELGGGGIWNRDRVLNLANTIVAANESPIGADCMGSVTAEAPNLLQSLAGCVFTGLSPVLGVPLLGPLMSNGGPTKTHAPVPGSPAVDAGADIVCDSSSVDAIDQRGAPRPSGTHCDIGAFEGTGPVPLSVTDVWAAEGNAGVRALVFTVTLSAPAAAQVTIHVATANGSALANTDYTAISGTTLTFNPGETSIPVTVFVIGDESVEPSETFFLNLSNPTGAVIAKGQGVGTIFNDDPAPPMVVTTLADANPPVTDGLCSLREAITNANTNALVYPDCPPGVGNDAIVFTVNGTIRLVNALPNLTDSAGLLIDAAGRKLAVSGNSLYRPIQVSGGVAEIRGLHIEFGQAATPDLRGGGVWNSGALTLRNLTIRGNQTPETGSVGGGGVHNQGVMVLDSVTVANNRAVSNSNEALGGGVSNTGHMAISNSTISNNRANNSGSSWSNYADGGGIFNTGSLVVINSTITENAADQRPCFSICGPRDPGTNGIYNQGAFAMINSILAGNGSRDCGGTQPVEIRGPNLIGTPQWCSTFGATPVIGAPLLGALANNGGPTPTHALLPGSPAIDAGDDAYCTTAPVNGLDQRRFTRRQGSHCDLGAYEANGQIGVSVTDVSRSEGDAGATEFGFVLSLSALSPVPVSVIAATTDGTAAAPSDYSAVPATLLTFAVGETTKQVTVWVNGDASPEANEAFLLLLTSPVSVTIIDGQGVGTILDDDTPGVIIIDKVTQPAGEAQSFSFTSTYGPPFALADVTPPHVSAPLAAGVYSVSEALPPEWLQTSAVCSDGSPVSAIAVGPGETVTCTFTNTKKGTVTLQNVMVGGTATFGYSGTPNGAININGGTLTEQVAPGTHITTQGTPAGWTLISVTCDDGDSGGVATSGQVTFQVAPGESVTCIVTNTKSAISIGDASVTEGNSGTKQLTFTVTRNAGLFVHDVAVDYATLDVSASAGSDYVATSGTLTIPKTSASSTVSVTVNGDTEFEFEIDETLKLLLSNPRNAVLTTPFGTGTILNDDAPSNPIGGKNLSITTGSIDLSWETGTTQTAYALLQYNSSTGVPTLINLPGTATSYGDAAANSGVVYCYVLAALGPGGAFLGLSDLVCGMSGVESGTVIPQGFDLTLGQSANATMTWAAPAGGADSYLLQRIPLDGSAITNVALGAAATSTTQAVVAAGTCFQLVAFKGAGFGTSDVLCGVPGVSTLSKPSSGKLQTVGEALTAVERILASVAQATEPFGRVSD